MFLCFYLSVFQSEIEKRYFCLSVSQFLSHVSWWLSDFWQTPSVSSFCIFVFLLFVFWLFYFFVFLSFYCTSWICSVKTWCVYKKVLNDLKVCKFKYNFKFIQISCIKATLFCTLSLIFLNKTKLKEKQQKLL